MNKKVDVVITMAGLGSRFRKVGYTVPKYMIQAHGRTLFEWSLESLEGFRNVVDCYIFLVRKEDKAAAFIRETCCAMNIKNIHLIELDTLTDGQATTALLAMSKWNPQHALLIYNIDTYVEAGQMRFEDLRGDGYIPCFFGEGDHWSFVRVDDMGRAVEVREKKRISNNCTLGAYYFSSCKLYENLYKEYYANKKLGEKGEKYVAPLYNYMIEQGMDVYISLVEKEKVHVLGTPEELSIFMKEFQPK